MPNDQGFHDQIDSTLAFEGGYVSDPNDPGGETNFGISKAAYPDLDIAHLTRDEAVAIYYRDYWTKPGWGHLDPLIGAKCFDMGVNMGTRMATRLLQRACNILNAQPQLAIDGILGERTQWAELQIPPPVLLAELRLQAETHYRSIVELHPPLAKYLEGWLRRARA